MSTKTQRLFTLLQLLRSYRYPVSARVLSDALAISVRTVYRDIADLKTQGADIEGEPGLGYQLKPGFLLPPLMFDHNEIEAMVLGMRWVINKTDPELQHAAKQVLNKIRTVLPDNLKNVLDFSSLMVGPNAISCLDDDAMATLRQAIRGSKKIDISYVDLNENLTRRTLWPLGIAFFDGIRILIAWCEQRQAFRHFRTDRIQEIHETQIRYPKPKMQLLALWRKENNIPNS